VNQLATIAEYISIASPVYAEHVVDQVVRRLRQVRDFPASGRRIPEAPDSDVREVIEPPYRIVYRVSSSFVEVIAIVHGRQDLVDHLEK
jgi:toxin ParE1/3/4